MYEMCSSEGDILQNTNSKEEETAILFSGAVFFFP